MNVDQYKYRISVSSDKVKINMNPRALTDMMYYR